MKTSKYAKKRIKVDLKVFLKNCDNDKVLKFTKAFKQLHFNLLIQEDPKCFDETLSSSDSDKITVQDPYSEIKKSLKNILINRCGVKIDELN
jgi:hypothetical protein